MEQLKYDIYWRFKLKRSNSRALKALKKIESYKGKVNTKFQKLSNEYAIEVLGNKAYAPWLYVYCAMQNRFLEGWIPDNYYAKEVVPKLNGDYGKVGDRNFIIPFLLPQIDSLDIAYFINGKFCGPDSKVIDINEIKNFLFDKNNRIVFKLENSKRGQGVFILDRDNFDASIYFSNEYANGVFQKYIQQHPFFDQFANNSVATIRITTVSDAQGKISPRASYIRFGRTKDTHIKANSAVSIPIDINSGELHSTGYIKWSEIDKHPDSNILFHQQIIPYYKECVEKAVAMHSVIPFMGCLGWDLTVDASEKVQFIEVNGINNGIKFSEAITGPCFKDLNWDNLWKQKQGF
ncbi:sugar-transfer associated ATP-grasp domain-containing protein [Winogradskyella bathintestinalis]|uniref:Sugar-transfer associated ATP-grasp domain-containing protein n=1 Tax=Winogradskyella bathintestinalis TaxID=3035208 RepID=A0ABT7ZWN4_9FLAO|nr:sugar-transfer associated ATP-grasp domain-containing protein [Winogradskyella bathintestinalis]MDN3493427.1 sugar-transfer associated ATP-grasp domain-containing protein [Winogradskyella bathintestinalis]